MPVDPQTPYRNFDDAPGGDLSFDDLFPSDEAYPNAPPPQAAPAGNPTPQDQPAQPQATPTFEIKTRTGTVYKSLEEATRGTEVKDSTIAELRQRIIAMTGVDPLNNKHVSQGQPQAPQDVNFLENPDAYYQACEAASTKRDPKAWAAAQSKFIEDTLAPYREDLQDISRRRAVEQVSNTVPAVREFVGSKEYTEVLDSMPVLKRGIEVAESMPQYRKDLPDLYQIAYLAAQGRNLAKQPQVTQPPAAPQAPARVQATTTLAPPADSPHAHPSQWATNREARLSLIQDMQNKGVADTLWANLGK